MKTKKQIEPEGVWHNNKFYVTIGYKDSMEPKLVKLWKKIVEFITFDIMWWLFPPTELMKRFERDIARYERYRIEDENKKAMEQKS